MTPKATKVGRRRRPRKNQTLATHPLRELASIDPFIPFPILLAHLFHFYLVCLANRSPSERTVTSIPAQLLFYVSLAGGTERQPFHSRHHPQNVSREQSPAPIG